MAPQATAPSRPEEDTPMPTTMRRVRRALVATPVALALAVAGAVAAPSAVAVARAGTPDGSVLLLEPFDGRSVPDPRVLSLGAACLTAASAGATPPAGASDLGPCPSGSGDGPTVGAAAGYLQLTDDLPDQAGGVVLDRAVPAEAGLVVEYDHFMYRTRYGLGADGIGLVLVDGAHDLRALGAFGGSLGYAQDATSPGVPGAYLGVGFDPYGNFARDVTGRGTGCSVTSPYAQPVLNSVTLRGAGDGTEGYCWLATSELDQRDQLLDWGGRATPSVLIPGAQRNVRVTISPDARPVVTVEIDFTGTRSAYQTVLTHTMDDVAPDTYKLGFAAATGAEHNVHLVRDVEVRTVEPLSPLHLVAQVAQVDELPDAFRTGRVPHRRGRAGRPRRDQHRRGAADRRRGACAAGRPGLGVRRPGPRAGRVGDGLGDLPRLRRGTGRARPHGRARPRRHRDRRRRVGDGRRHGDGADHREPRARGRRGRRGGRRRRRSRDGR
jgi:hypothetical protein